MTFEWPVGLARCADCCRYAVCEVCGAYRSRGVAVYPAGWRVSPEGACCSVCAMAREVDRG